jgi:hypothetical protein
MEIGTGAAILFVIVNVVFFPFVWGNLTLQESTNHAPSLYVSGSRQPAAVPFRAYTVVDSGVGAWQMEPQFGLEHRLIFGDHTAPIWNPYTAFGAPLAANMTSAPYSPLSWIPIVWPNARAYDASLVFRLYVGGFFAFLFLRQFIAMVPALVGAAAFMFSGYFWLYLTLHQLSVEVLLPALLYGVERLLRRPSGGAAVFLGIVLGCTVFGGMPECTVLAVLFAMAYGLARLFGNPAFRNELGSRLTYAMLASIIGLGLSAVQAIPFLEYVGTSANFHTGTSFGLGADPRSWAYLATYLAPLFQGPPWGYIFSPNFVQDYSGIRGFFGCATSFFALVAIIGQVEDILRRRERDMVPAIFFAATAGLLVAKRFGLFFVNWIGGLPLLRDIILAHYDEAMVACCVSLLAGIGVARIAERRVSGATMWLAAALPVAVLSAAAASERSAFAVLPSHREYFVLGFGAALAFLGVAAALVLAASRGRLTASAFGVLALAVVVGEPVATYYAPMYFVVNTPAPQTASAYLGAPYIDVLRGELRDGKRFFGTDGLLFPAWSSVFAIPDVRGLDALYTPRFLPFVRAFLTDRGEDDLQTRFVGRGDDLNAPLSRRFLTLASVGIVGTGQPLDPANFERRAQVLPGVADLYAYRAPLPRVAVYRRVIRAADETAALAHLAEPAFDPFSEAVVEGSAPGLDELVHGPAIAAAGGTLELYTPRYVRARVDPAGPAFVVLNDTMFPGWEATLDGRQVPILDANVLFRGIVVGAGRHVVEYRYRPLSYMLGAAISLLTLAAALIIVVLPRIRRNWSGKVFR